MVYEMTSQSVMLDMLRVNNEFMDNVKESQKMDVKFVDLMGSSNQTKESYFKVDEQGVLRFRGRMCIPDDPELK